MKKIISKICLLCGLVAALGSTSLAATRDLHAFDFSTLSDGPVTAPESSVPSTTVLDTILPTVTAEIPMPEGYHFSEVGAYTYNMLYEDIRSLSVNYPEFGYSSIGTTVDGREIYLLRVGSAGAGKRIFVSAAIHGREYITAQLTMRQAASLLEMQRTNYAFSDQNMASVLQNVAVYFVPMANPDGVTIAQMGLGGIGQESIRQSLVQMMAQDGESDVSAYLSRWKSNANGVNLNKNFDANWDITNDAKGYPARDEYKGPKVESEVESQALANLIRQNNFAYTLSYHTQGKVIYWRFTDGSYLTKARELAEMISRYSGYLVSDYYSETDAAGLKDWAEANLDIPSVTIECGYGTSPVPETQIEEIWNGQKAVLPDLLCSIW